MGQEDQPNPYEPTASPSGDGPASDGGPVSGTPSTEKLIVLATFDNSPEAHLLRNTLAEAGIDARVGNETSTAIFGATIAGASSAFWIEVLVLASDANKALEIKNQLLAASAEVTIPEWSCECGELVDAGFAVCWSCESDFPGVIDD